MLPTEREVSPFVHSRIVRSSRHRSIRRFRLSSGSSTKGISWNLARNFNERQINKSCASRPIVCALRGPLAPPLFSSLVADSASSYTDLCSLALSVLFLSLSLSTARRRAARVSRHKSASVNSEWTGRFSISPRPLSRGDTYLVELWWLRNIVSD